VPAPSAPRLRRWEIVGRSPRLRRWEPNVLKGRLQACLHASPRVRTSTRM
jgi:hypothetical protein